MSLKRTRDRRKSASEPNARAVNTVIHPISVTNFSLKLPGTAVFLSTVKCDIHSISRSTAATVRNEL